MTQERIKVIASFQKVQISILRKEKMQNQFQRKQKNLTSKSKWKYQKLILKKLQIRNNLKK
jgi:hypothetical protein